MAAEEVQEDVFFKDKKAMTISEVAIALDQCTSERKLRDPSYQPNLLVTKTLEYTNTVSTNKNPDTVRKIRSVLAEAGMSEQELALVANLQLQTAEEAKTLVPTLARYADDDMNRLLAEIEAYREFE